MGPVAPKGGRVITDLHPNGKGHVLREHVLERAGCPIHYWPSDGTEQPLVVFTHGAGADHLMFNAQVAAFAKAYRLLVWDVRGHGASRPLGAAFAIRTVVDDLLAILDLVGVDRAVFVGQSMGGNVAQELLFLHPERVTALVVVGSTCNTLALSRLERFQLRIAPALLRLYPYALLKRQSVRASSLDGEVRAYLRKTLGNLSKDELIAVLRETTKCLRDEPTYRITVPLLLTHGDRDGLGNIRKVARRWAAREPRCRYVVIPNAGHCAHQDNPGFFNALLRAFLEEVA